MDKQGIEGAGWRRWSLVGMATTASGATNRSALLASPFNDPTSVCPPTGLP